MIAESGLSDQGEESICRAFLVCILFLFLDSLAGLIWVVPGNLGLSFGLAWSLLSEDIPVTRSDDGVIDWNAFLQRGREVHLGTLAENRFGSPLERVASFFG